ncbi:MAG: GNAT family N-acetyltransferase [Tepidisphaeraceae bacterium]
MTTTQGRYIIDDDATRHDWDRVHLWLTTAYWCAGISRELVERAAVGSSLVVGAYLDGVEVGYLRVVSDCATFAWVCDVFIDEKHRGVGLATAMLRFAMSHPTHQNLRRWVLATRDAHRVYETCGFAPLPFPERWMMYKPGQS